jgi:hypothetical protein
MGGCDSHNNAEVRGLLAPLAELAARRQVAVLAITHLRKGAGSAINRSIGSIAFVAAARAAYAVARDPDDDTCRIFGPLKNNLGDDRTGFRFRLIPGEGSARVSWDSTPFEPDMDGLMNRPSPRREREEGVRAAPALEDAKDWLRSALANGPRPCKELMAEATGRGEISEKSLRRAKSDLEIESIKDGKNRWLWALPDGKGEAGHVGRLHQSTLLEATGGIETEDGQVAFFDGMKGPLRAEYPAMEVGDQRRWPFGSARKTGKPWLRWVTAWGSGRQPFCGSRLAWVSRSSMIS